MLNCAQIWSQRTPREYEYEHEKSLFLKRIPLRALKKFQVWKSFVKHLLRTCVTSQEQHKHKSPVKEANCPSTLLMQSWTQCAIFDKDLLLSTLLKLTEFLSVRVVSKPLKSKMLNSFIVTWTSFWLLRRNHIEWSSTLILGIHPWFSNNTFTAAP